MENAPNVSTVTIEAQKMDFTQLVQKIANAENENINNHETVPSYLSPVPLDYYKYCMAQPVVGKA